MRKAEIVVFIKQKMTLRDGGVFTAFTGAVAQPFLVASSGGGWHGVPALAGRTSWRLKTALLARKSPRQLVRDIISNSAFAGDPWLIEAEAESVAGSEAESEAESAGAVRRLDARCDHR
jgi:hypothetical protein